MWRPHTCSTKCQHAKNIKYKQNAAWDICTASVFDWSIKTWVKFLCFTWTLTCIIQFNQAIYKTVQLAHPTYLHYYHNFSLVNLNTINTLKYLKPLHPIFYNNFFIILLMLTFDLIFNIQINIMQYYDPIFAPKRKKLKKTKESFKPQWSSFVIFNIFPFTTCKYKISILQLTTFLQS